MTKSELRKKQENKLKPIFKRILVITIIMSVIFIYFFLIIKIPVWVGVACIWLRIPLSLICLLMIPFVLWLIIKPVPAGILFLFGAVVFPFYFIITGRNFFNKIIDICEKYYELLRGEWDGEDSFTFKPFDLFMEWAFRDMK